MAWHDAYNHPRRYPRPNSRLVLKLHQAVETYQRHAVAGMPIPRELAQGVVDAADMVLVDMRPKVRLPNDEWIEEEPEPRIRSARKDPRTVPGVQGDRVAG